MYLPTRTEPLLRPTYDLRTRMFGMVTSEILLYLSKNFDANMDSYDEDDHETVLLAERSEGIKLY